MSPHWSCYTNYGFTLVLRPNTKPEETRFLYKPPIDIINGLVNAINATKFQLWFGLWNVIHRFVLCFIPRVDAPNTKLGEGQFQTFGG